MHLPNSQIYKNFGESMNPFDIMKASQIACCLEVSSFKPGNVHRNRDYRDIKYHHFINAGIAFGNVVYEAAQKDRDVGLYIKKQLLRVKNGLQLMPT